RSSGQAGARADDGSSRGCRSHDRDVVCVPQLKRRYPSRFRLKIYMFLGGHFVSSGGQNCNLFWHLREPQPPKGFTLQSRPQSTITALSQRRNQTPRQIILLLSDCRLPTAYFLLFSRNSVKLIINIFAP